MGIKVYTVHAPPGGGRDVTETAERLLFVKEGFAWPALFFGPLWLLAHAMWWVLLLWIAVAVALGVSGELFPAMEPFIAPAAVALSVLFALEANGLRRWSLERKGWRLAGIATGRSYDECERDFFARWLVAGPAIVPVRARATTGPAATVPTAGSQEDSVIGMFPRPN